MRITESTDRYRFVGLAAVALLCVSARWSPAAAYVQTDLVSDIPGLATITDPELKNSWGMSESATSPIWVSNQGTDSSTLYSITKIVNVTKVNINPPSGFVAIPTTSTGPQGPTGQVSNSNASSFLVSGGDGKAAHFIFANLNGSISAWDGGTASHIQATTAGAVYTGLAINSAQTRLYAANDAGSGSINVFDNSFTPVNLGASAFVDPNLPAALVPFNVQDIGGKVYVTYAPAGRADQTGAALGQGVVDVYDENGVLLQRVITGSQLAAPWGVALAPSDFGRFSDDLLVGNFSYNNSEINAFDPTTGAFEGTIPIDVGANSAGGLWDLTFGNGKSGGNPDTLYFADGLNGETDGLLGALSVPEPASLLVFGTAVALLLTRRSRR